jgi:tripartite-type tricarboxylate transporter receptor subunit TctC
VHADTPARSVKELVAWVKADPSRLAYGTPGAGTLPHFFAVLFGRAAGLDWQHVTYRGSAGALKDLIGGQLPVLVTTNTDLLEAHRGGRIRILATSDAQRSEFLPDIPTFKESGYAIEGTAWYGMFAPAKTPKDLVAKLSAAIAKAVKTPEIAARLRAVALAPTGTTPEEFSAIQKRDAAFWLPAVKASGFVATD